MPNVPQPPKAIDYVKVSQQFSELTTMFAGNKPALKKLRRLEKLINASTPATLPTNNPKSGKEYYQKVTLLIQISRLIEDHQESIRTAWEVLKEAFRDFFNDP